jgi:phosphocarrier protein
MSRTDEQQTQGRRAPAASCEARAGAETQEGTLEKLICEREVEIKNAAGLHMRPAMQFVDTASQFRSDIAVSNATTKADGKSIMQMSMLAATCGTKLRILAEGPDAQDAIEALQELVEVKKFGEPAPGENAGEQVQ